MATRILITDDHRALRAGLRALLWDARPPGLPAPYTASGSGHHNVCSSSAHVGYGSRCRKRWA